jgi:hypothetical protein
MFSNVMQMDGTTLTDPDEQPSKVPPLRDPQERPQLLNSAKPGMIERVDRHCTTPCEGYLLAQTTLLGLAVPVNSSFGKVSGS